MSLTIEEIYSIKCTIANALFLGRHDWEERITVDVTSCKGLKDAYLRFRMASANVTLDNDDIVYVHCTDGRKPIKFKHESIEVTSERIAAELSAHFAGHNF
jgi:hypothetical protein